MRQGVGYRSVDVPLETRAGLATRWEAIGVGTQGEMTVHAVVLTALGVEHAAVRSHLSHVSTRKHRSGTVYEVGELMSSRGRPTVAVAEVGAGARTAAAHAERAIDEFGPRALIFVGIAGSLKPAKVHLGDVVVASKVYAYHGGKSAERFRPRPEAFSPSHTLEQDARHVRRMGAWLRRLGAERSSTPSVHFDPIATGDVVIDGEGGGVRRLISAHYDDAVAVEMEGAGVLAAAHLSSDVPALIVRGISDLASGKSVSDGRGWQVTASAHAAAFAAEVISVTSSRGEAPRAREASPGRLEGEDKGRVEIGVVHVGPGSSGSVVNTTRLGGVVITEGGRRHS